MERVRRGYFEVTADGVYPGDRYRYLVDNIGEFPDPASRYQPDGVHGYSEVVDPAKFRWDNHWKVMPLSEFIIYEIHTGTFTREGTFDAVIPLLGYLCGLGVTAIEIMPVSQFPGGRNWGYDGVYPFAPQNTYGGPAGLKRLINAAHNSGLAVIMDVVYNHLGPEGNYLGNFGYYFTDKYKTPWGDAMNFDGPESNEVRRYFISNAVYWLTEYKCDALRIDAIHGIFDFSAVHFLEELKSTVEAEAKRLERDVYVIVESDLNDVRVLNSREKGGYAIDAQWSDDFHHSVHTLLTGERAGYYEDFGSMDNLVKAFREGFVYTGGYSVHRRRRHGSVSVHLPAEKFVISVQNHDQTGNRIMGERLSGILPMEQLRLAAGVMLLSPFIPLLFMGEEYGETAPFQYFISHSDKALIDAVRKGRKEESDAFGLAGDAPDPQSGETFLRSKINIDLHNSGKHKMLFNLYKELIGLRKNLPSLRNLSKENMEARADGNVLYIRRWFENDVTFMIFNFDEKAVSNPAMPQGKWGELLDSSSELWGGTGAEEYEINPFSFKLYRGT